MEGEERAEGVEGEGVDYHQHFVSSDSEGKLVEVSASSHMGMDLTGLFLHS